MFVCRGGQQGCAQREARALGGDRAQVETTAEAEPTSEDEQDAGDETPEAEEPATDAAPTITIAAVRAAERFLRTGFRYSDARLDRMDEAAVVKEASERIDETLKLAGFSERNIKAMNQLSSMISAVTACANPAGTRR